MRACNVLISDARDWKTGPGARHFWIRHCLLRRTSNLIRVDRGRWKTFIFLTCLTISIFIIVIGLFVLKRSLRRFFPFFFLLRNSPLSFVLVSRQKVNQVIDFKTRLLGNLDQRNRQQNAQFLSPVPKTSSIGNKVSPEILRRTPTIRAQPITAQPKRRRTNVIRAYDGTWLVFSPGRRRRIRRVTDSE